MERPIISSFTIHGLPACLDINSDSITNKFVEMERIISNSQWHFSKENKLGGHNSFWLTKIRISCLKARNRLRYISCRIFLYFHELELGPLKSCAGHLTDVLSRMILHLYRFKFLKQSLSFNGCTTRIDICTIGIQNTIWMQPSRCTDAPSPLHG